jgi:3-hydroxyacyl-[acyl-carrier-protein] dehydratase
MQLPDSDILRYIPQRYPIILVDTLCAVSDGLTITSFEVKACSLFVKDGILHEPGLIENIAQTAAAGLGYQCALNKQVVPVGFIGAIKNLTVDYMPVIGDVIETRVKVLEEIFDMSLIKGESFVGDKRVVECEMKIVLKK